MFNYLPKTYLNDLSTIGDVFGSYLISTPTNNGGNELLAETYSDSAIGEPNFIRDLVGLSQQLTSYKEMLSSTAHNRAHHM